jgi:hypothetical protein
VGIIPIKTLLKLKLYYLYYFYELSGMGQKDKGSCLSTEWQNRVAQCSEIGIGIRKVGEAKGVSKTMATIEFNKQ